MDIVVSDKHKDINKKIENILINALINNFKFVCSSKNLWKHEFDTVIDEEEFIYYIRQCIIEKIFNGDMIEDMTIFELGNIPYEMDYKTFSFMCKFIKREYDYMGAYNTQFCELFDMHTNTEQRVINDYVYFYIHSKIRDELLDSPIIHIYRKIAKYNYHNNKHSGLIRLYNKLDILNKKKIVIEKILHDKFDTDILENILQSYGSEYNSDLED